MASYTLLTEAQRRVLWSKLAARLQAKARRDPTLLDTVGRDQRIFSSVGHLRRALAGTTLPTGRSLQRLRDLLQKL